MVEPDILTRRQKTLEDLSDVISALEDALTPVPSTIVADTQPSTPARQSRRGSVVQTEVEENATVKSQDNAHAPVEEPITAESVQNSPPTETKRDDQQEDQLEKDKSIVKGNQEQVPIPEIAKDASYEAEPKARVEATAFQRSSTSTSGIPAFHDRFAVIVHAVRKPEANGSGEYSSYRITVQGTGDIRTGLGTEPYTYAIFRRFRNFVSLKKVVKPYADLSGNKEFKACIARFPRKQLLNHNGDAVIAGRMSALNDFMSELHDFSMVYPEVRLALNIFLAPDEELMDNFTEATFRYFRERIEEDGPLEPLMDIPSLFGSVSHLDEADSLLGREGPAPSHKVPFWDMLLYAWHPWASSGDVALAPTIAYGKLYVNVVEARGVMASDLSIFGDATSDPYCELSLGAVIPTDTRRTRHITNTLNPVWDEEFVIHVYRPYSTLTIKVFDYDRYSKDDHIGEARLSVEMLRDQKLHDVWLKLQPDSSVTYKKEDVDLESRGHIHLRLRFQYSPTGEFFASCLDPEIPPSPAFSVHLLYFQGMRFSGSIQPIITGITSITDTLFWTYPFKSICYFILCVSVVLYPQLFFPSFQLLIVKYIVKRWVYLRMENAIQRDIPRDTLAPHNGAPEPVLDQANNNAVDARDAVVPHVATADEINENAKEEVDQGFALTLVGGALETLFLVTPDLRTTLQGTQNFLGGTADSLEALFQLFDWSTPEVTKGVLIGLTVGAIITFFIPYHYLMITVITMAFVLPTPVGSKIVKVIAAFAGAVGKLVSGPGAPPVSCNIPPIVVPPRKPVQGALRRTKTAPKHIGKPLQLNASKSAPNL